MSKDHFTKTFIDISHLIQSEFERNVQKYGSKIKCRKGCSQCCYQIFRITSLDAYIIKNHLDRLPYEEKDSLREKAKSYIKNFSENNSDGESFLKQSIPCPALGNEGECTIYEARPVICRRFGPPIYDYKTPDNIFACELNFESGEEILDDELIPKQTLIGKEWDKLKTEFNEAYKIDKGVTTIAEAIAHC